MRPLEEGLKAYNSRRMCSFHTPGHKGRKDLFQDIAFPEYDLTELPGLDMLHAPRGIIAHAQERAAEIFGAEESYFLVNGGTAGNQAMFLTLAACFPDRKVRIERQAHRSVMSALILSGLTPEYIPPIIHPDYNLPLGLEAPKYTDNPEKIGAFHLTYPSYYGTLSDLAYIIRYRNENFSDILIFVDQAHGSHYRGRLFPRGALELGADLVLHSTHKTLGALTQAAMLHVRGNRVNRSILRQSLEILQTSSPSYLFLTSLEKAGEQALQGEAWQGLYEEVKVLHAKLKGKIRILTEEDAGSYGIKEVDWSKILVNVSALGLDAPEAVETLRNQFGIEPELWDEENILFILGIGNSPEDVRRLRKALEYVAEKSGRRASRGKAGKPASRKALDNWLSAGKNRTVPIPPMRLTPREAWFAPRRKVALRDSLGKVSAETISLYPPGIPLIVIGEEITSHVLEQLGQAHKFQWQGWEGWREGKIWIVDL